MNRMYRRKELAAEQNDSRRFVSQFDRKLGRYVAVIMGRTVVQNLLLRSIVKWVFFLRIFLVCVAI